jgi:hypothetical protein
MFSENVEPIPEIQREELRAKLSELKALQEQHRIRGVSFAVLDGEVTTEDSLDYVLDVVKKSVEMIAREEDVLDPGYCPPK